MRTTTCFLAIAMGLTMVALQVGCDGDVTSSTGGEGGSGASGSSTSSGAGGSVSSGDCASDADCAGGKCVELTPGGYKVCQITYPEATQCQDPGLDQCCTTSDCAMGVCMKEPIQPYCGGPAPVDYNVCAQDLCSSDADCAQFGQAICVPAGTLERKVRACVPVSCKVNTDCNAESGGSCLPVFDPCCNAPVGLFCVYKSDGCRSSADCMNGYCAITPEGRTRCEPGGPVCPA